MLARATPNTIDWVSIARLRDTDERHRSRRPRWPPMLPSSRTGVDPCDPSLASSFLVRSVDQHCRVALLGDLEVRCSRGVTSARRVERSVLAAFGAILIARLVVWPYAAAGNRIPTGTDVRSAQQGTALIVVDLVLLVVVLILYRWGSSSRIRVALTCWSSTEDLLEANRSITSYAARVETATAVEESHRLASELHETLAHSLSGLTTQLGAIDARWDSDPVGAKHQLNEAEQIARVGLSEARRAMQALAASPLEDLGLQQAVTADIEQTVDTSDVATIAWLRDCQSPGVTMSGRLGVDRRWPRSVVSLPIASATRNHWQHMMSGLGNAW